MCESNEYHNELNEKERDIDITSDEYKRLQQKNIGLQLYANCRQMGRAGFEPA
jgi:hypothetical protein